MGDQNNDRSVFRGNLKMDNLERVQLTDEIIELENGFSAVRYEGDMVLMRFLLLAALPLTGRWRAF